MFTGNALHISIAIHTDSFYLTGDRSKHSTPLILPVVVVVVSSCSVLTDFFLQIISQITASYVVRFPPCHSLLAYHLSLEKGARA